jgi:uncharacterized protein
MSFMQQETKTALITGASTGIGFALAEVFAEHGYKLVLVARNEERLATAQEKLQKKFGISVQVIAIDLTKPGASEEIFEKTERAGTHIDVLVNNAGFAEYGAFAEANLQGQLDMVALNIATLTHLTHLFLREMIERKSGKILNVASTAAFQPGPFMAVYYASKAYVLSFSEAVREESRGSGISVTALCPGPTETEFFKKQPAMLGSRLIRGGQLMTAKKVAEIGYQGLMANKAVVIPGLKNKLIAWSTRFGPRSLVTKISRWTLEKGK